MRVLIACEESQEVCKAFRARGHEAYSCDIHDCSGGHPEWHIKADALELLKMRWDLIIAHPPCTYMTNAGAVRMRVGGVCKLTDTKKPWRPRPSSCGFMRQIVQESPLKTLHP